MSKKSQEESEQVVKNYQLEAVEAQVQSLQNQMKEGFNQANEGIRTLIQKSESQVTPQQLNDNITALRSTFEQQIKESEEKQTIRIDNLEKDVVRNNKNVNTFTKIIIGIAITLFTSMVGIVLNGRGG